MKEPRFIDTPAAAAMIGLSTKTLEQWRGQGRGPAFYRLGRPGKKIVYKVTDLEAFMVQSRVATIDQPVEACAE